MLVNVWVKDDLDGSIHQVGTDERDSLQFIDGKVEYQNFKNGDSTAYGGYKFCDAPSSALNKPLKLTLDKAEGDVTSEEYSKCQFCKAYDNHEAGRGYEGNMRCYCSEDYRPDKAKIIKIAKETGLSVSDIIALINM